VHLIYTNNESRQTKERLHTERGTARVERDATQQWVGSLEAKLERERARKLDAENASARLMADLGWEKAKVLTLDEELHKARMNLEAEASEHDMLRATIGVVCEDLEVA
jgi:hypothetical protein